MSFTFESFSEDCERKVSELLEETYDYTRCQRADGSFYGTGGQCRKGTTAEDKAKSAPSREGGEESHKPSEEVAEIREELEFYRKALRKIPNKPSNSRDRREVVDSIRELQRRLGDAVAAQSGNEKESAPKALRTSKKESKKRADISSTTASAVKAALKKNPQNAALFNTIKDAEKRMSAADKERAQIRSALTRKNAADVSGKEKRLRELDREWGAADLAKAKGLKALNTRVRQAMQLAREQAPAPRSLKEENKANEVAARREKALRDSERTESWKREFGALMRGNRPTKAKNGKSVQDQIYDANRIAEKRAERNARKMRG